MKRLEQLQQELRQLQMNEEERKHLRELLLSHIDKNPVKDREGLPVLLLKSPTSFFKTRLAIFLLAFIAVIVATAVFMAR